MSFSLTAFFLKLLYIYIFIGKQIIIIIKASRFRDVLVGGEYTKRGKISERTHATPSSYIQRRRV